MIYKTYNLKDYYRVLTKDVYLTVYCPDNYEEVDLKRKRKSILVCPGGGYWYTSKREAEPIALRFVAYDINAFLLHYNCDKLVYPYPAIEGFAALAFIRSHAEEFNVDVNCLGAVGFSAGGHFAGTLSMWSESKDMAKLLEVDPSLLKVNYFISCYSVITMDEKVTHIGTMENVSHREPELMEKYSIEKHVTKDFPPTLVWATEDDQAVPVQNSKLLKAALDKAGVKNECYIFPHGIHGLSLADESVYSDEFYKEQNIESSKDVREWTNLAVNFIKSL